MTALITAVVPVRDGAAFVAEAVESVLAQTYAPVECVVVDDGSTDDTPAILRGFGDRIRVVAGGGHGVAAARNAGAAASDAPFIAFLDADDLWEPDKLARQLALFDRRPGLGLVYAGLRVVDAGGRVLRELTPVEPAAALRHTLLDVPPYVSLAQTGVVRRAAFAAAGCFDERLSTSADSDLVWRLAVRGEIAAVDAPLARYRTHPGQMHRDLTVYARDWSAVLDAAFGSGLLPGEIQRLERRARANLALVLGRRGRALALAPGPTSARLGAAVLRRLTRRAPRGASARAS